MSEIVKIKKYRVNNKEYDLDLSEVGKLYSKEGNEFSLKVDDEGNLYTTAVEPLPAYGGPSNTPTKAEITKFNKETKLYINELYCGGQNADEHTINYCSHNFVELANATTVDINLDGMTLQYARNSSDWKVLPLKGVIKAGSTFLIRGRQCSCLTSPTTKIIVDTYDMEWLDEDGKPIVFDDISCKFYLAYNLNKYEHENPYDSSNESYVASDAIGYIDLVGIKGGNNDPGGAENKPYSGDGGLSTTRLFKKYFALDPSKQANKAKDKRNNANDWNFVDLTKEDGDVIPSIKAFTPKASYQNKNLFYNKTDLRTDRPTVITCTFGIQATDNGSGATRCFNWVTRNLHEDYIWIKRVSDSSWGTAHESFYAGDGRSEYTLTDYNRIVKEYSNNRVIIVHKFIMSGLTKGTYEYVAGAKNEDGTPNLERCTPKRKFIVREDNDVKDGFKFVQTSDQQGFNWDEYRVWNAASKVIMKENNDLDFMINTGDMVQSGNRLGEWLDYFDAECDEMQDLEEMATVGNNDLSLRDLYVMISGDDDSKLWLENFTFFYTFELDEDNLPYFYGPDRSIEPYHIPSLYSFNYGKIHFMCVVTEIKASAEELSDGYGFGEMVGALDAKSGYFYPQIKAWCERDVEKNSEKDWTIVYCHEMPFTILTPTHIYGPYATGDKKTEKITSRPGSNANTNAPTATKYWLSEFCQTHGIRLVIGGHKHTQAITWPILENVSYDANGVRTVDSLHPIVVVTPQTIGNFGGASDLFPYNGYKYPNSWFTNGEPKDEKTSIGLDYVTFEYAENIQPTKYRNNDDESTLDEGVTQKPVVYAMSQATGYKHTSNKELPCDTLPWQRFYFPSKTSSYDNHDAPSVNAEQKFPFYTVWEITPTKITGNVRKVYGAFNNSGKFDINIDGKYVKKGYCATTDPNVGDHSTQLFSINGLTSMTPLEAKTDTRVLEITKN